VLRAYVTALVGAGRDALAGRDAPRAFALCDEAVRWLPARTDAQACLTQARPANTATATVASTVVARPTGSVILGPPTPGTTATRPPIPSPPAPGGPTSDPSGVTTDLPQVPALDDLMPILERLREQLSRSGPLLTPGTPTPLDGGP
jgi:hypothetical protein